MPLPLINYPYPTQIAAGQNLDANPVWQDFVQVASAYNAHTHVSAEITDYITPTSICPKFVGEPFIWPNPNILPSWAAASFMLCEGATVWAASFPALATPMAYVGGNASILMLPDTKGRTIVGLASAGPSAINAVAKNDGRLATLRNIFHTHTVVGARLSAVAGNYNAAGGNTADQGATITGDTNNVDSPAYAVFPFAVRVL